MADRRSTQGIVKGWESPTVPMKLLRMAGTTCHSVASGQAGQCSWLKHICQRLHSLETA